MASTATAPVRGASLISRITSIEQLKPHVDFVLEALATCPFVTDTRKALVEVARELGDPDVLLIVDAPVGLLLGRNNPGEFMKGVTGTHLYSKAPGVAVELMNQLHAFAIERGAPEVFGVDVNKRPKAYERLFRRWNLTPEGQFFSYKVN